MSGYGNNRSGGYARLIHVLVVVVVVVGFVVLFFQFFGTSAVKRTTAVVAPPVERSPVRPTVHLTTEGVIIQTNKARLENGGAAPVTENPLLNAVAAERVNDMFKHQYFAHVSPTGESVTDAAQRVGYRYSRLGENIAEGYFATDEKLVQGWMQSPGHRKNLLSGEYSEIGVAIKKGVMKGDEVWLAVQVFGRKAPPVTEAAAAPEAPRERQIWDPCIRPDESVLRNINALKAEVGEMRTALDDGRAQIESLRPLVEKRGEGDRSALLAEYNAKVQNYNQLLQEAKGKEAQLRDLAARYNADVDRYNACIKR